MLVASKEVCIKYRSVCRSHLAYTETDSPEGSSKQCGQHKFLPVYIRANRLVQLRVITITL